MTPTENLDLLRRLSALLHSLEARGVDSEGDMNLSSLAAETSQAVESLNAIRALAPEEPLLPASDATKQLYFSDKDKGNLYFEEDSRFFPAFKWFKFPARRMSPPDAFFSTAKFDKRPDIGLEPVPPEINSLYEQAPRSRVGRLVDKLVEDLTLLEVEDFLLHLMAARNRLVRRRKDALKTLAVDQGDVPRLYLHDWRIAQPSIHSPNQKKKDQFERARLAAEKEAAAAEKKSAAAKRANAALGRNLQKMPIGDDGLIHCQVHEGTFVAPFYEAHTRGRNWATIIKNGRRGRWLDGTKDAAGTKRYSVAGSKSGVLAPGDVIEFAGDYYNLVRMPTRAFYLVVQVDALWITFLPLTAEKPSEAEQAGKQKLPLGAPTHQGMLPTSSNPV